MHQFLIADHNGRIERLQSYGGVQSTINLLAELSVPSTDKGGRVDHGLFQTSMALTERMLGKVRADAADYVGALDRRADDFAAGLGSFNPRDLTYRFQRVYEEKMPPLNMTKAFSVNTEVSPGALHYEQYRGYSTGEAVIYRGGSGADIPTVELAQASFRQNVVYVVSKAQINWLEQLRTQFGGLDTQTRKLRVTRRVIDELLNKWTFEGAPEHGLYGLFDHPYLDTALSLIDYGTGAADDIVADFGDWANYAENESGSTFQPNALLIAPKLANKLRNLRYGDNADKSIMDWMLSANPHITTVIPCRELNDAGGAGVHAMFFYRRGGAAENTAEVVVPMTPTPLPPETKSLVSDFYTAAGFGGLNFREVGDALLVYATVS